MSRYDFIRFGGFVNRADEDTDTFRKMKVCLPVKEPVEDDTKIGLISTDEDNPEEIAVSYSVRAAELIPWTDSFQEGYLESPDSGRGKRSRHGRIAAHAQRCRTMPDGMCLPDAPERCLQTVSGPVPAVPKWRKCLRLSHGMTGNILSGN
ncbi:hypothetical protein NXX09_24150 [Bacteroides uniformis]|nr:hypothetical protein [Bacteroides uniformis]